MSDALLITQLHSEVMLVIKFLECFQQIQVKRKEWFALKLFTKLSNSYSTLFLIIQGQDVSL